MGLRSHLNLRGRSLTGAIAELEAAEKEFSHIDFSELTDITKLKSFIEQADLFRVVVPEEVEKHSKLAWHRAANGGFILFLPNRNKVRLTQNLLDKWDISAVIDGNTFEGSEDSLEAAFDHADGFIQEQKPHDIRMVKRQAAWHDHDATEKQLKTLRRLYKGKPLPPNLKKGQASSLIAEGFAQRA